MPEERSAIYEFEGFRLDIRERILCRDGEQISLTPKAFATLACLVQNHGRLVDKSQLIEEVWDGAFVEESVVSRSIWSIRSALGDDSREQRIIKTVSKRGYRFIAEVFEPSDAAANGTSNGIVEPVLRRKNVIPIGGTGSNQLNIALNERPENTVLFPIPRTNDARMSPADTRDSRKLLLPALAILSLVLIAGAYLGYLAFVGSSASSQNERTRIAILPLKPVFADVRDPIAEFAIAESLIIKMSSSPDLVVRPLGAVRKYVELDRDPIEAGKELNADFVLSSNYQMSEGKIRVTSQLFNTRTGVSEATYKTEHDAQDKFDMQDAIANVIGDNVLARFGFTRTNFIAKRGTTNEEAYRLYLQGHYLVEKKTQRDAERAIEIFESALKLDPVYAQAWAGKANAYCTFAHAGGIEPKVAFETAKPALAKAFELDANLPEAHAVRGIITFDYDWEFEKGLDAFRKSIELDPNYEMAGRAYATRLAITGQYDKALVQIKAAIDIFPNSLMHQLDYATVLYRSGRFDEAVGQLQRVLELDPNMPVAVNLMWISHHMNGDPNNAFKWFMTYQEMRGTAPNVLAVYRDVYGKDGWDGVLKRSSEIMRSEYVTGQYNKTTSLNLLLSVLTGDRDTAISFLADGIKYRNLWIPTAIHDPAYQSLRQDPAVIGLLKNAGLVKAD